MSKRDNDRLKKIRLMGCCADNCGKQAVAAHSNFGIHGKARGLKADDKYVIPLCVEHHYQFDTYSMGMNRQQSLEWFMQKWTETNQLIKWQKRKVEQNGVDY